MLWKLIRLAKTRVTKTISFFSPSTFTRYLLKNLTKIPIENFAKILSRSKRKKDHRGPIPLLRQFNLSRFWKNHRSTVHSRTYLTPVTLLNRGWVHNWWGGRRVQSSVSLRVYISLWKIYNPVIGGDQPANIPIFTVKLSSWCVRAHSHLLIEPDVTCSFDRPRNDGRLPSQVFEKPPPVIITYSVVVHELERDGR